MRYSLLFVLTVFHFLSFSQEVLWSHLIDSSSVFSSPRLIDLNQDDILDVVVGAGLDDSLNHYNGIVAINGTDGSLLWETESIGQVYTSALFQDINNDLIPDVFIGGRFAGFKAIDGSDGSVIWEFWNGSVQAAMDNGWFNFYCTEFVPDVNQDGFLDVLVANGGNAFTNTTADRYTGNIMILDALSGTILAKDTIPMMRETYYAPHTHKNHGEDSISIIFGCGGETINGKVFEVSLTELLNEDISDAREINTDTAKGFISNSALTDLNSDGKLDIITPGMGGMITAIDGLSHNKIWEISYDSSEAYSAPSIGYFNGDQIPDVFAFIAHGEFPSYDYSLAIAIDGSNGNVIYTDTFRFFQFGQALTLDWNQDGIDEVLLIRNFVDPLDDSIKHRFEIVYPTLDSIYYLDSVFLGAVPLSVPSIQDIDGDNNFELIYAAHNSGTNPFGKSTMIRCVELDPLIDTITWNGYLGPLENGVLDNSYESFLVLDEFRNSDLNVYPNPTSNWLNIRFQGQLTLTQVIDGNGRIIIETNDMNVNTSRLDSGVYIIKAQSAHGTTFVKSFMVE